MHKDSTMYHKMIMANPLTPKIANSGIHTSKKMKLTLLSFHEKFLNLSENMGTSEISSHEERHTNIKRYSGWKDSPVTKECIPEPIAPQNKALAGTGRPMNDEVCRVSLLNLASLKPENTAMRKAP